MSWYKRIFTTDDILNGQMDLIRREFGMMYLDSDAPDGAAMLLGEYNREGAGECTIYISPKGIEIADVLIKQYRLEKCDVPKNKEIDSVAVGDTLILDILV